MQHRWLNRSRGAAQVIVVFGGWAIGPAVMSHLGGRADLLFVSDYRDLAAPLPDLSGYASRTLVAWSLGVACYGHWQAAHPDPFDRRIAINGSMTPVNRRTGIAPRLMRHTARSLSEAGFQQFLARCHGASQPHQPIDVAARRAELAAVMNRGDAPDRHWHRVWISRHDVIFTPDKLHRAWQGQAAVIRVIDAPHVPFALWSDWEQVLA